MGKTMGEMMGEKGIPGVPVGTWGSWRFMRIPWGSNGFQRVPWGLLGVPGDS